MRTPPQSAELSPQCAAKRAPARSPPLNVTGPALKKSMPLTSWSFVTGENWFELVASKKLTQLNAALPITAVAPGPNARSKPCSRR